MKLTPNQKRVIVKIKESNLKEISYQSLKERNLGVIIKALKGKGVLDYSERIEKIGGIPVPVYSLKNLKLPEIKGKIESKDYEPKRKNSTDYYRAEVAKIREDPEAYEQYRKRKNEYRKKYRAENPEKAKEARRKQYEKEKQDPAKMEKMRARWRARRARPRAPKKLKEMAPKPKTKTKESKEGLGKINPKHLMNLGLEECDLSPKALAICGNGGKISRVHVEEGLNEILKIVKERHGEESLFSDYRVLSRYFYGEVVRGEKQVM